MAGVEEPWVKMSLPLGWEAKYDIAQKRYFFIDHNSKTTTWEDPRAKFWQQQQRGQQLQVSSSSSSQGGLQGASSPSRQAPVSPGYQNKPATSHASEPQRGSTHIRQGEPLRGTSPSRQGDFQKGSTPSRQVDPLMGISPGHHIESQRGSTPSRQGEPQRGSTPIRQGEPQRGLTPNIQLTSSSHQADQPRGSAPSQQVEPPRSKPALSSKLSAAGTQQKGLSSSSPDRSHQQQVGHTKHRQSTEYTHDLLSSVRDQLLREFPDSSLSVVQLALETCSFDESKARQLLKSFNATCRPSNTASALTVTSHIAAVDTSSEFSAASLIQGIFSSHQMDTTTNSTTSGPNVLYAGYTHVGSDSAGSNVDTSQHKSLAKGPDSSLVNGPNQNLLLNDYMPSRGSQPSLHVGPDPLNCTGPCPNLHSGPQACRVTGPSVVLATTH